MAMDLWYSNGVKESVVTFNQGEQEGIFSYFYDNGNKKSEGIVSSKVKRTEVLGHIWKYSKLYQRWLGE